MIGKQILHYKILEELGRGGMGVVYKAHDSKLKREVAIKFLPRQIAASEEERARFKIEAQAAAALNHPNIATIFAIEEVDDELFIVMEYIEGRELRETITNSQLSIDNVLNYATQIASGLQAAHEKGIVHRDVKSSNIMVTKTDQIKIMDFGLAKISGEAQLTKDRSTLGTVAYMSPEQARGDVVNHQTDIWSLGVVLYTMITGELPFRGDYEQAIIYSILYEAIPADKKMESHSSLKTVVKKALEKDREKRYNHIGELITDLESIKKGKSIERSADEDITPDIKKIAVLPFSNILNDPETNFLGFALADQIIGSMTYLKNVLVRSSSSVRKFQNEIVDIYKAGSELKVDYILTGNYLKESGAVRLNIEFIEIESEKMIWRERIDIKYKNVFELQDIVSQKVIDGLKVQFSEEERNRMNAGAPQNPVAYEFYLRAISYPHTIKGANMAVKMINNSITLDSDYAPAYLELGYRYNMLSKVGEGGVHAADKAEEALLKALSLKNDLLPALAYLGLNYTEAGRHEEAHALLIRALEINPNHAWIHFSLGYHYRYIGILKESLKEMEKAFAIDPQNPRFRSAILTYMYLGKYDQTLKSFSIDLESPFTLNVLGETAFRKGKKELALQYFEKSLQIKDEIGESYFANSFVEYMNGNVEKAAEINHQRELPNPADGEIWYEIARVYGLLEKKDDCIRTLKKSIDMGFICYPFMQTDSFLDSLRHDSQIQKLFEEAREKHEEIKKKILLTN